MRKWIGIALCVAMLAGLFPAHADDVELEPVTPVVLEEPVEPVEPVPVDEPEETEEPTPEPTQKPAPSIELEPTVKAKAKSIDPEKLEVDDLQAGTLQDRLDEAGITNELLDLVQQLTIESGALNDRDFKCIRRMSDLRILTMRDASVENDALPEEALMDLSELREVYLPVPGKKETDRSRITSIGARALSGCAKLNTLSGVAEIESVGDEALSGCAKLTKLKMVSLGRIGDGAFSGCTKLSEFDFSQVYAVGASAFSGCTALKAASLGKVDEVGASAFRDCTALTNLKVGSGAVIGDGAFSGCSKLSDASLGKASSIGAYAFEGCKHLTSISLSQCADLGQGAFSGCRRLEKVEWPKSFVSAGPDSFDGCAIDFSKGFPKGLDADASGRQRPRVYFSLSEKSGTVYVGEDWDAPATYLRTRRGTSFKSIIGDDWVDANVELPKITRKPKTVYTDEAGEQTIRYTLPEDTFANDHEICYTLYVVEEEPDPTPSPTPSPTPTPRLTPPPIEAQDDVIWATLPGLTLTEMELTLDRQVFDPALRSEVADYASQMVYPIDLTAVSAEAQTRIPLISRGYQLGELVITRSVDDPETPDFEEEAGLTFSLEPAESAALFEATLQIAVLPEQLDPCLAQRPEEALPDEDQEDAIPLSIDEDDDAPEHCFYPLDALLDVNGQVLLYVNAAVEYQPEEMPVYVMPLEQRAALTEQMQTWIIPSEEDANTKVE